MLWKRVLFFLFVFLATSFIYHTDIYFNRYSNFLSKIVKNHFSLESFKFSKIKGNLILGFEIYDIHISLNHYNLNSNKAFLKFDSIFSLDYIESYEGKISYLSTPSEFKIKDNIFEVGESEKFNFNNLLITKNDTFYEINLKGEKYKKYEMNLSDIDVHCSIKDLNNFHTQINVNEMIFFKKKFSDISVFLTYKDNTLTLDIPKNTSSQSHFISANVEIKVPTINIYSAKIKFANSDSLHVVNQSLNFSKILSGEEVKVNYRDGFVMINKFKLQDAQNYFFDLRFENFDLRLFEGLKARGKLSGDLFISNNNSAIFKNTKIRNFSFDKIKLDEIKAEGYIADDFYKLSDINVTKKIGFIDISSFYNKIIEELNLKY